MLIRDVMAMIKRHSSVKVALLMLCKSIPSLALQ